MFIFGGTGSRTLSAKRYNPRLDVWIPVTEGPEPRERPTAVWTGAEVIIWGGQFSSWLYRIALNCVWTGAEVIIWGGQSPFAFEFFNTGGRYDPRKDVWSPMSIKGAPEPRRNHTAVWTGSEMIIWGGRGPTGIGRSVELNTGGRYKPYLMIGAESG
jgi:hypothetical protein